MPRARARSAKEPLPPPLAPETRTVGQLVAETLRLYGRRFWLALPLGLSLALVNQVAAERSIAEQVVILCAGAPLLTLSYVAAAAIAAEVRPDGRTIATAVAAGVVAFLPVPFLTRIYVLPGIAWLALVGLVVPAVVVERRTIPNAFGRAIALARADYLHALGSLATLVITFALTRLMLGFLLRDTGDQTERVAAFLADVVLSPILFLGAALLYFDQAARVVVSGPRKRARRSRRHAHVHPADDAHRSGRADAEGEPGAAARGEP